MNNLRIPVILHLFIILTCLRLHLHWFLYAFLQSDLSASLVAKSECMCHQFCSKKLKMNIEQFYFIFCCLGGILMKSIKFQKTKQNSSPHFNFANKHKTHHHNTYAQIFFLLLNTVQESLEKLQIPFK